MAYPKKILKIGTLPPVIYWASAALLLFLPLFWINQVRFFSSDSLTYSNLLALTSDAIRSGDFYSRWFAAANNGLGNPTMMFNVPLAYIITTFINLPLSPLHLGIGAQLVIGLYFSQVVSGYTAWLWLKRSFSSQVALAGSLLFIVLPYKLVYIYLNGNLAQLWALAFLPLWMMAAENMVSGNRRAIGQYALVFALVYYTHTITIIAFGAIPGCYVLWFGRHQRPLACYAKLFLAHLLAIGLCLMQALPQRYYLGWIHADEFYTRFNWRENFGHIDVMLCSYYGIIAALVGYAIHALPVLHQQNTAKVSRFWIVVLCILFFMTQKASTLIWQHFAFLHYLQFPAARLHSGALIAIIYLICVWLGNYKDALPLAPAGYRRSSLAILIMLFGAITINHIYKIFYKMDDDITPMLATFISDIRDSKIISAPEYMTRWDCIEPNKIVAQYRSHITLPLIALEQGRAEFTVKDWHPPYHIVFTANVLTRQATFQLHQCYVPAWQAKDNTGHMIPVSPGKPLGLIEVTLPTGQHDIEIAMVATPVEYWSRWCTVLSAILCLFLLGTQETRAVKNIA